MKPADDFSDLGGGLFYWEAYDPANKVDLSAAALAVAGGLFFIDPIALRAEALEELLAAAGDAAPAGILLTNANHARAAEAFRRRFAIPVLAHAEAADGLGLAPDAALNDGQTHAASGFTAIRLPGAAPGEIALFHPANGGVLLVGDAIINLPSAGFSLLPAKYCANAKELRRSAGRLLEYPFTKMFFAHGPPLLTGAKSRLETLLKTS